MVRFSRLPSFSYPYYTHRLPDHYYKYLMELRKPATRVHDRAPPADFHGLKYNEDNKQV